MPHADFVHLHVHSAYSLSEGAIRIPDLVKLCRANRMPAIAIADTGNLFGALEFSTACRDAGVQPIIGTSIALRLKETESGDARAPEPDRIVLLARNETGYANLMKLSSLSHLATPGGETPQVGLDDLVERAEGLIVLTGGTTGPVDTFIAKGQLDAAEGLLLRLGKIFPGALYVELQRYGERAPVAETELLTLAYRHDFPLVATNEVFFADAGMYEAHDVLICVAEGAYVSQSDRRRLTPEHRFKTAEEMRTLFSDLPEALDNTLVIAQRCAVAALPRDPILPKFDTGGRDEGAELRSQAEAGLEARLAGEVFTDGMDADARKSAAAPYHERLAFELDVIIKMNYGGYFLIVADFIRWAREKRIPVGPGRGSGAGSVVAWSLTITDLDPLRFGLLFERFLNPERVSMPDFDIDFCQDRRDEVIQYVQQVYGRDRVAQIITFGKLQARAVLRDVGRVLQLPYGLVDRICKMVPNNPANPVKLADAIAGEPKFAQLRHTEEGVGRLLDIALKLEGLYRHASTHAAGVVIGDRPLDELIPLYRDPRSDMPVTQFSMKYAEEAGLVKFDFLGLKTLTVIDRTRTLLAARGIEIDPSRLPLDDTKTYEMLQRAESVGVFQFESRGMSDLLRDAVPSNIEDLIALVALFRPGPMENIPKYVACKHGREKPEFLHETIEPVVKDTYGVIIYQEQVMQIAQVFAGFSLGQADLLRRAMGKKIKSEMRAQRDVFIEGAVARGVDRDRASYVFDLVDKFAGYGFNKAHSACYAYIAYQTAWLKANHPVEFLAASMSLELNNTDKIEVYHRELKRLEIPLLGPDINKSQAVFSVETAEDGGGAVRYALAAIKNVGRAAMEHLTAERERNGPFKNLRDFTNRVDPMQVNKRQLENLVRAGAFDSLSDNRAAVLGGVETILRYASAAAQDRVSNQSNMFADMETEADEDLPLPDTQPWRSTDLLREEFAAIGFFLSAHPLDEYGATLARLGVVSSANVLDRLNGDTQRLKVAGTVLGLRERTSARGKRYAFVELTDTSGMYEVTIFSEQLSSARELLEAGRSVLLSIDARMDDGQARLTAQNIQSLDEAAANAAAGLEIFLDDKDGRAAVGPLGAILASAPKGRGRISLCLDLGAREVEIEVPGSFAISPGVRAEIVQTRGVSRVRDI
ncbi:MAG: DNA polymerase III subunit alpha [Proteobacteria bacterium]|nr:DNA polymerase III subunit alpha [Pseudomonadota bacterium]